MKKIKKKEVESPDTLGELLKEKKHLVSVSMRIPAELQLFYIELLAKLCLENKRRISQTELFESILTSYATKLGYKKHSI